MPRVITETHQWVLAAFVDADDKQARYAAKRGTITVPGGKIDVLEVLCAMCRKPWEDVADQPCSAADGTEHLRGGPIGERKKRKHPHHDCQSVGCEYFVAASAAAVSR